MEGTSSSRRSSDVYKNIACWPLQTPLGTGQCVIAKEPTLGKHVLITNHHVLPSKDKAKGCSLIIKDKPTKLMLEDVYSCCGPNSVWREKTSPHEAQCCPRNEDWTAVILQSEFVQKIEKAHTMEFPELCSYEMEHIGADLSIFERLISSEKIYPHAVVIPLPRNGKETLEDGVNNYRRQFTLQYRRTELSDIGEGCSGAPIFYKPSDKRITLLGIHCSTSTSDDNGANHAGLSINFIIASLYCGGLPIKCSLLATLSFLRYMTPELKGAPLPPVLLDQVLSSIESEKRDQRDYLEKVKHSPTELEWKKKYFLFNIEILKFVLSEMKVILQESYDLTSDSTGLSTIKFLTALFSIFNDSTTSDINSVVGSKDDGEGMLQNIISRLSQKLLQLFQSRLKSSTVLKAAFELLSTLLIFSCDQGPACCFLETTNVRMLGNLATSDIAESDISTMKVCFTAYLRTMQLSYQEDNAKVRLKSEAELDTAKKKIVQLQEALTQKESENEELKNKCEHAMLAREQIEIEREQIERQYIELEKQYKTLDEENEEQARKIVALEQPVTAMASNQENDEVYQDEDAQQRASCLMAVNFSSHEPLKKKAAAAIQKMTGDIVQYMDSLEISAMFFEKQLLTVSEFEHFNSLTENKKKNLYIIPKICKKGHEGILLFIECLLGSATEVPAHKTLAEELQSLL